jgi:hypothetical protein
VLYGVSKVEATACTSPEPDEYRLYTELPVLVKQQFYYREWIVIRRPENIIGKLVVIGWWPSDYR